MDGTLPNGSNGAFTSSEPASLQVAQGTDVVGSITFLSGSAVITRTDGTQIDATQGTPVFKNDIVETGTSSRIEIVFEDESNIGLASEGRLAIDEFVYNAGDDSGSMSIQIAKGLFSFVSGALAKSGDENMELTTPVATIGIRGTSGIGLAAPEGQVNNFVLLPDPDGTVGEFSIRNLAGNEILSAPLSTVTVTSSVSPPTSPQVLTLAELQERYPGIIEMLGAVLDLIETQEQEEGEEQEGSDGDQGFLDDGAETATDTADAEEVLEAELELNLEELTEEEIALLDEDVLAEILNDLETAAGTDAFDAEDELILGDAPTFGEEDDLLLAIDGLDDLSLFLNDLTSSNDVEIFGPGFDGSFDGAGFGAGTDPEDKARDDDAVLSGAGVEGDGGAALPIVGGLTGIAAPVTATFFREGVGEVVVRTPTSLFGGISGTDAFEQVQINVPGEGGSEESGGGSSLSIEQDADGNLVMTGPGINLALNDIEEMDINLPGAGDGIDIDALNRDEEMSDSIFIKAGPGDDTITLSDGIDSNLDLFGNSGDDTLGGSSGSDDILGDAGDDQIFGGGGDDELLGGTGDDTLNGGIGNDTVFGGGGELLAGDAHDWGVPVGLPIFSEITPFDITNATAADQANLTFDGEQKIGIRFLSEGAGYRNSFGYYKIGEDGSIFDVKFIFENASLAGSGGDLSSGDEVMLDIGPGEQIGLFLIPNGFARNNKYQDMDFEHGGLEFREQGGDPATVDSYRPQLVYVEGETETVLVGTGIHTASSKLNLYGSTGAFVGVNPENNSLRIGFEDIPRPSIDGSDFNDTVVELFVQTESIDPTDNDVLFGGEGNDTIYGESGNDILDGGTGIDVLFGGSGNDVLIGGEGFDVLHGGTGADIFQFNSVLDTPEGGRDVIMDFEGRSDQIFLNDLLTGDFELTINAVERFKFEVLVDADGDSQTDMTIEVNVVDGQALTEDHIVQAVPTS